jgi:hypothetical protein
VDQANDELNIVVASMKCRIMPNEELNMAKVTIDWIRKTDELPIGDERVLVYSPCYESQYVGHEMTYRVISGQFVRICTDVSHWARLHSPAS